MKVDNLPDLKPFYQTDKSGVSNLSHCRTFVRQTGQNVRQVIFKYDPFFWRFEEKITEVSQNVLCRETKTVLSSPDGPLLINTPSLSKHRFYAFRTITCR